MALFLIDKNVRMYLYPFGKIKIMLTFYRHLKSKERDAFSRSVFNKLKG